MKLIYQSTEYSLKFNWYEQKEKRPGIMEKKSPYIPYQKEKDS